MKFRLLALLLSTFCFTLSAQDKALDTKDIKEMDKKDAKEGWTKAGALGLDFSLLNLINPRAGSGDNRFGFGGLINYLANLKQGKVLWDNKFNIQAAVVKVASDPYTKAVDVLQATSQWGYQMSSNGKWYGAGLADFQTQFLPTYGKNFLKSETINGVKQTITGKLFSPAIFKFAPGIIHKPNTNWSFLYSPIALKAVIVADQTIANQATFIPLKDGKAQKSDLQMGSELRIDHNNKFANDKIIYLSTLDLYSNYLRDPQNIDIEWYNSLDFMVAKNLSINFKSDWFYDHDIFTFKDTDKTKPTGRNIFNRNAILLKYGRTF
jgi:hypothetical protein